MVMRQEAIGMDALAYLVVACYPGWPTHHSAAVDGNDSVPQSKDAYMGDDSL